MMVAALAILVHTYVRIDTDGEEPQSTGQKKENAKYYRYKVLVVYLCTVVA